MTIDEAIAQYEQFANVCEHHELTASQEEFEQLAAWLRELQNRRKAPEIIRCKDCKFYTSMNPKEKIGICSLACRHLGDDGFCSNAERRTE